MAAQPSRSSRIVVTDDNPALMAFLVTNTRWGEVTNRELIKVVRSKRPELPILHIGDPMPNPDGLLDDVPALRQPFTPDQLLEKVRDLVAHQSGKI